MTLGAESGHSRELDLHRKTFLRRHIAATLERLDEVLAVRDRRSAGAVRVRPVRDRRRTLLDQFFQVDEPDDRLYLPLALKPLDTTSGSKVWPSLTQALVAAVPAGQPPGIVLSARTGAGKTLATISTFVTPCFPSRSQGNDHHPAAARGLAARAVGNGLAERALSGWARKRGYWRG